MYSLRLLTCLCCFWCLTVAPTPAQTTPARPASKPATTKPATTKAPQTASTASTKAVTTNKPTTPTTARKLPPTAPKTATGKPRPALPTNLNSSDQNTRYQNGKVLLDQGRYDLAMQELAPLTPPAARFERGAEAAYLYAVAATRAKKWAEAEQMLNLIRAEYDKWENLPEAMFLQAQVSFEQGEPDNALQVLEQIPNKTLAAEQEGMKATYLARIQDKALFQNLLQRYPKDAAVGRAYADKLIAGGWYTEADKPVLEQLIKDFSLDRARYSAIPQAQKKAIYRVAVLLPFEFNDPSWEKVRRNQFVTDLYAGLLLAQDSLQREGRPVQLFAYDTGADTIQLKQVLTLPELASMDMIIGPIYKSGSKLLARYAQQRQIITINPLSQDGNLIISNNWHYLFEPSMATQAQVAAQYAFRTFSGRTAAVLHEDTSDDLAFAQAYKTAYEALGGKVQVLRRLNSNLEESLIAGFTGVDLASLGHLVVASDNRKAGAYTLKHLQNQAAQLPLITYGSWLENPSVNPSRLDARDVYLIHRKYLDPTSFGVRRFRQLYVQRHNLPPSVFAHSGFELLYYFGHQLHQHGPAFQQGLATSGPISGVLFQGIGYPNGAHDNQYVPLIKLERLEVEVQNPVGGR
ncbi:ABC transporter substrate-binding protein [Hymenobacter sp. BT188]|nr:ABC transporter substrate-binding protein [Hymenobacter sp. BT188]